MAKRAIPTPPEITVPMNMLDKMNLATIKQAVVGPSGHIVPLTMANVILLAFHVTASVIDAGMFDRFRPGGAAHSRTPPL